MSSADLKRIRTVAKIRFTRARNSLQEAITKALIRKTVDSRYDIFRNSWQDVQKCHDDYIVTLTDEEADDSWIDELCDSFNTLEADTDIYIDSLENQRIKEEQNEVQIKLHNEKKLLWESKNIDRKLDQEREILKNLIKRDQEGLKFGKILENINKLIEMNSDESDNSHIVKTMNDLLIKFETSLDDCMSAHQSYVALISDEEEREKESKWINITMETFHQLFQRGKLFTNRYKRGENEIENTGCNKMKIKNLEFESFKGNIRKYPRFKEQFLKHIKPRYKASEEAFVLRSFLDTEIKDEVENVGENADDIWDRLDRKYGNISKLIEAIMSDIKSIKKCDGSPTRTIKMISTVEKAHRDLVYLKREEEINNATIIAMIEEKLPEEIESEWLKLVTGDNKSEVEKRKFIELLKLLLQFKERIEYKHASIRNSSTPHSKESSFNVNLVEQSTEENPEKKPWCWLHLSANDHPIWRCREFQGKPVNERLSLVKLNKACFSCLSQGHTTRNCRRNFLCRQEGCNLPHHDLLHEAYVKGKSFHGYSERAEKTNPLLQLQEIKASNHNGKIVNINVLWDAGSTMSFITFEKAKLLNLKGSKERLQIMKVGAKIENLDSYRYTFSIIDKFGESIEITALGLETISSDICNIKSKELIKLFPETIINDFTRPENGQIDCLFGFDYASLHPIRQNAVGNLILLRNRFGSIIAGTHPKLHEGTDKVIGNVVINHIKVGFAEFYDIENLGIQCFPACGRCGCGKCHPGGKDMTLQEEREYKMITDGLIYNANNRRWTARYPFVKDPNKLPNNREAVFNALLSTEKRLNRNPVLAEVYQEQITDMIARGACRKLCYSEMNNYKGPTFYISHHAVLKPESKSTPCRIVFNSSANYHGHVLNEYYAKGPQMLNNLLGILLRFREQRFAAVGDIKKMYHLINFSLVDQMTHRFLWRDLDTSRSPDEYVMTVVNFGDKPSGAIAIAALRSTSDMGSKVSQEASRIIKENSYMDDILESFESPTIRLKAIEDIEKILKEGNFQIKEWVISGCQDDSYLKQDGKSENSVKIKSISSEKVLGLNWKPEEDVFYFNTKLNFSPKERGLYTKPHLKRAEIISNIPLTLTKRQILSQVNGIYDPLGLLSPFIVKAKILLRKLWGQDKSIGWDVPIPEQFKGEWIKFFTELYEVENITFKRCIKPVNAVGNPILIVFSDGSGDIYGAVAYARWKLEDGKFKTCLLAAKNRIAPLKIIDIVRLELCGAVIGKRLRMFILNEMRLNFSKIYHIIDSEIVKAMISKESYGFNTFAANRIGEIQQQTDPSEWYWLSGKLNIADCVTRGKSPKELQEDSIWQEGPAFLCTAENCWPISQDCNIEDLPERPKQAFHIKEEKIETILDRIDITRFRNLKFLLNTTARVLSLYRRFKGNTQNKMKEICVPDLENAERLWTVEAQTDLKTKIAYGSLRKLCPQIKDGIIVVGGRTERWMAATWNRQQFILLPYEHRFSRLIAEQKHNQLGHLGVSATVAGIRSKYWITKLRKLATDISRKCIGCKKKYERLCGQIMADLPLQRIKPAPPFSSTGCDYFGPFIIRGEVQKRVRGKCFGVLFTCLITRAVYVDISHDYTTDSFIQVIKRFSCMHGWPSYIYSDRGSNLVAASKELKGVISKLDENQLRCLGLEHGMEWEFSSPDAPWMNGATESLVKSVKRALNVSIGDQVLSYSELQTVMFECGQLVNQRPIGINPVNPEDGSYICPNDLLLGRSTAETPQGPFGKHSNKSRLNFIVELTSAFWKKWTRDCFPNLVIRAKWHTTKRK